MSRVRSVLAGIPWFDGVLSAVLIAAALASTVTNPAAAHPISEIVAVLVTGSVALRTVAPMVMAVAASAGIVALAFLPDPATPLWAFVTLLVIAFSIAVRLSGVPAIVALAVLLAAVYVIQARTSSSTTDVLLTPLILVSAPAIAGWLLARSRAQARELRELTSRLEESQERIAVLSAEAERTRLVREFHDVLGHTLSSIAVQAGAAGELLDDGTPAAVVVAQIRRAARDGLDEVRAVLDAQDRYDAAQGIEGIAALAEMDGAAFHVSGDVRPLTAAGARAAYRIVQESLTNARRHAPGAPVQVTLDYEADELCIEVVNGGPIPPVHEGGRGVTGIRERALSVGGSADAGPRDDGWGVRVQLPLAAGSTGVSPPPAEMFSR